MIGKLKNCLKRFFSPTIYIFNREICALREDLKNELQNQLHTRDVELWQELESRLSELQQELEERIEALRALETEIGGRILEGQRQSKDQTISALWDSQRSAIETLRVLETEMGGRILEEQRQGKDQTISTLWDSRNSALWETKEEMRTYNRQWQQIFWYWLAVRNDVSLLQAKKTFFKQLPKAEGSVRLIQEMELYLLRQFTRLCSKYGLKYWMTDGSLLGAVRHEGFVPWDDDMDVGMPRADFERLKEVLADNRHFQIVDYYCLAEPRWYSKISKFVDLDSGSSAFIDLFPYDYYDAETRQEVLAQYHSRRAELVSELEKLIPTLKFRYRDVRVEDLADKAALDAVFAKCVSEYPESGQWLGWSVEIWESEARIGFPGNVMFPCGERTFEGIPVSVPADEETWLEQVYGEYMEFPRDTGIQNHMKMFGLYQQEEQIRNFLQRKTAQEETHPQRRETEGEDGSGQAPEVSP